MCFLLYKCWAKKHLSKSVCYFFYYIEFFFISNYKYEVKMNSIDVV